MKNNVETTEIKGSENRAMEAAFLLERSANVCRPEGFKYSGSITVHVYEQSLSLNPTYAFATHFAEDLPEQLAIEAAKELKVRLMARYGHKERKQNH